ncbi:MAG: LarC family nickel insertion protein [Clostridiales bacterium]|nr:LarC family nickel insertion protein [Clostridiales bacterium]
MTSRDGEGRDTIWKLETNLDDCTGENLGFVMELLLSAGARDVYYQPIYMKKNRPACLLSVICTEERRTALEALIFQHTTTIGIRRVEMERTVLPRRMAWAETVLGPVAVKVCTLPDGSERAYPEYDSVAALCRATGESYQTVYRLAQTAWEAGNTAQ